MGEIESGPAGLIAKVSGSSADAASRDRVADSSVDITSAATLSRTSTCVDEASTAGQKRMMPHAAHTAAVIMRRGLRLGIHQLEIFDPIGDIHPVGALGRADIT